MKKSVLILLSLAFIFIACDKEEETETPNEQPFAPKQEQWGFAINYTATWCGPCGDWGAPLIHDLADAGDVVAITAHASNDPMFNSAMYSSFNGDRPSGGSIPAFWIGDEKSTELNDMNSLLQKVPIAGIAIKSSKTDSSITIQTKTEFFEAAGSKFFLSVLILEDGIDGSANAGDYEQNGVANPSNYEHDFVLRTSSVSDNAYGEEIVVSPAQGTIIEKEYVITLNPNWGSNVYPVAILWQVDLFDSPNFKFINAIK